jgi:hypothetical protein
MRMIMDFQELLPDKFNSIQTLGRGLLSLGQPAHARDVKVLTDEQAQDNFRWGVSHTPACSDTSSPGLLVPVDTTGHLPGVDPII